MSSLQPKAVLLIQGSSAHALTEAALQHREDALDEALMESFPASDPIAVSIDTGINGATRNGKPRWKHQTECGPESEVCS
jgi:hypothetical protein